MLALPSLPALAPALPWDWNLNDNPRTLALCIGALVLSGIFSTLHESLRRSLPARVLALPQAQARSARLASLLEQADALATSATILKLTADVLFVGLLLTWMGHGSALAWPTLGLTLALAAPSLMLFTITLPGSVARAMGDRLLVSALPTFALIQIPVRLLVALHDATRRAIQRSLHLPTETPEERLLVEGLRGLAETTLDKGELEEDELELVMNVMEFGDVDAAEVMTPRTEIHGLASDATLEEAAALFTEVSHSRVPVFDEKIDNIIGTLRALDVIEALSAEPTPKLADLIRPPLLVPETKLVSTLLEEFRDGRHKMAIVLDEYGGTAGVVTLMDVIEEIVGDIQNEDEDSEPAIRELADGNFEIQATLHVSEVNEALGLTLAEESDFETLAGFVLAELGHFPREGEEFEHEKVRYRVAEATDRRVLRVHVTPHLRNPSS
jgi:putative hemolysin